MNTTKKGKIRFLIFKEKGGRLFTGVCLDFGLVVEGKTADEVRKELQIASAGYLKTILRQKLSDDLLNNQAEKKYFDLYEKLLAKELKSVRNPESQISKDFDEYCVDSMAINNLCYA